MRKKYGNWTVLKDLGTRYVGESFDNIIKKRRPQYSRYYRVKCKCGTIKEVKVSNLTTGKSTQCIKCLYKKRLKHGMTNTSEHRTWKAMKQRCLNENNKHYKDYGGRGIKICKRWLKSFENFYKNMGKRPGKLYSLDRKNNNRGYTPSNCRWATKKQQASNRRKRNNIKE